MGFPIVITWHLYIESGPWCHQAISIHHTDYIKWRCAVFLWSEWITTCDVTECYKMQIYFLSFSKLIHNIWVNIHYLILLNFLTHRCRMMHICAIELGRQCFRQWIVTISTLRWISLDWAFRNEKSQSFTIRYDFISREGITKCHLQNNGYLSPDSKCQ